MKHLFLLPALCLTFPAARAQQGPGGWGVKAGGSLTGLTNRNLASDHYLWGFHAGVTREFPLTASFSVQAEALYSQKGFQDNLDTGQSTYVNRLRLHYLDVPVLARFRAKGAFFEVGPQLGVLLAARVHNVAGDPEDYSVTRDYQRVDLGVVGGIGYQLASGPGIGLRYNTGLLDVSRTNLSGSALRNNAFQLYLSYRFSKP